MHWNLIFGVVLWVVSQKLFCSNAHCCALVSARTENRTPVSKIITSNDRVYPLMHGLPRPVSVSESRFVHSNALKYRYFLPQTSGSSSNDYLPGLLTLRGYFLL